MPIGGNQVEIPKKRSDKKRTKKKKSKQPLTTKKKSTNQTKIDEKSGRTEFTELTAANISSLRWENSLPDPILENDRIEKYKELRRQRYIDAQQKIIQTLMEKTKIG